MRALSVYLTIAILALGLSLAGCSQPAPAPTQAPAKPAEPAKAAAPAPTAAPAPAPTKAAEPTKPAAPAQPTAAPAAKLNWPEKGKTMSVIVPYAAGGPVDLIARLLAPFMEKELGAPVQVVNKPGASTLVGLTEMVNSKPDGYTLFFSSEPTNQVAYLDPANKANFTGKNIQQVVRISANPGFFAVRADLPYKNMKDVVDAARAKPETVKWATTGLMTTGSFPGYILEAETGVKFAFVHFDGGAPALTAVLGGHADVTSLNSSILAPQVKDGKVRVIASMGETESKWFPGVPSALQQGFKTSSVTSYGLLAAAGTPREIVNAISGGVKKILALDEVKNKMDGMSADISYLDPDQYAAWCTTQEADAKRILDLVKKMQK